MPISAMNPVEGEGQRRKKKPCLCGDVGEQYSYISKKQIQQLKICDLSYNHWSL